MSNLASTLYTRMVIPFIALFIDNDVAGLFFVLAGNRYPKNKKMKMSLFVSWPVSEHRNTSIQLNLCLPLRSFSV